MLISEAVLSSSLVFPRKVRPTDAIGQPLVVGFGDGAFPAFAACVYLQWQVPCVHGAKQCDLDFSASLLWAKARVTPLSGYTIPRSEISGAVLESRMCLRTVKALDREASMKPGGVIMLSDSKCTISAVDTTSRALKPFFHNRVAEIIDNMKEMKQFCPVEDFFIYLGSLILLILPLETRLFSLILGLTVSGRKVLIFFVPGGILGLSLESLPSLQFLMMRLEGLPFSQS